MWRKVGRVWLVSAAVAAMAGLGILGGLLEPAQARAARLAVEIGGPTLGGTGSSYYLLFPQANNQELLAGVDYASFPGDGEFALRVGMRWRARSGANSPFAEAGIQLASESNRTRFSLELGYGISHGLTSAGAQVFGLVRLNVGEQTFTAAALGLSFPLQ